MLGETTVDTSDASFLLRSELNMVVTTEECEEGMMKLWNVEEAVVREQWGCLFINMSYFSTPRNDHGPGWINVLQRGLPRRTPRVSLFSTVRCNHRAILLMALHKVLIRRPSLGALLTLCCVRHQLRTLITAVPPRAVLPHSCLKP